VKFLILFFYLVFAGITVEAMPSGTGAANANVRTEIAFRQYNAQNLDGGCHEGASLTVHVMQGDACVWCGEVRFRPKKKCSPWPREIYDALTSFQYQTYRPYRGLMGAGALPHIDLDTPEGKCGDNRLKIEEVDDVNSSWTWKSKLEIWR
jgi:hypothetical protein